MDDTWCSIVLLLDCVQGRESYVMRIFEFHALFLYVFLSYFFL
jgi:hypothetical protein